MNDPFIGGDTLTNGYLLLNPGRAFKYPTQSRTIKAIMANHTVQMKIRNETTSKQFDGDLDLSQAPSASTTNRLDKETFFTAVKDTVRFHGLQSFFHLPNADGVMTFLLAESHGFTVDDVIAEHESRCQVPPAAVIDPITLLETSASIVSRSKCYDVYETEDLAFTRLCIEALLTSALRETLSIRFSHHPGYDDLPGQVLFMMTLEASNVSAEQDIKGAETIYEALTLADYPGENISDFITAALKQLKIMNTNYGMAPDVGSKLIKKVSATESTTFNHRALNLLDDTWRMEHKYFLKDRALLKRDPQYATLGPFGLCTTLQTEYATLYKHKEWPALNSTLPEGNMAPAPATPIPENTRACYECGSLQHLRNNCPNGAGNSNGGGRQGRSGGGNSNASGSASTAWKYIHPADENQILETGGQSLEVL